MVITEHNQNSVAIATTRKEQKRREKMTVERFDKWLSENFYPAIAGLCPSLEMYKSMTPAVAKRYAELCEQRIT